MADDATSYKEAFEALFGNDPDDADEDDVEVYLDEPDGLDEDQAELLDLTDELETSLEFHDDPDKFIADHKNDPRVPLWEQIRDAERADPDPGSSAGPEPSKDPEEEDTDDEPEPEPKTEPTKKAAPSYGVAAGLMGGGLPPKRSTTAGLRATTTKRAGEPEPESEGRRGDAAELVQRILRPQPLQRSRAIPLVTRHVLASDRWSSYSAAVIASGIKLQSDSAKKKRQGRTEMNGWKHQARRYRDGQVLNSAVDKNFGSLLIRLIEALEESKNLTKKECFEANFVTGVYKPATD